LPDLDGTAKSIGSVMLGSKRGSVKMRTIESHPCPGEVVNFARVIRAYATLQSSNLHQMRTLPDLGLGITHPTYEHAALSSTHDNHRPAATSSDSDFTLTIDDALALYAEAGIPRTPRSIQRYCAYAESVNSASL
jgi:hypothetical protein